MTFPSDPTARSNDPAYGYGATPELPPLPTLAPLPVIKPMAPMPRPPWESDDAPAAPQSRAVPPPPPAGHPAATPSYPSAPEYSAAAPASAESRHAVAPETSGTGGWREGGAESPAAPSSAHESPTQPYGPRIPTYTPPAFPAPTAVSPAAPDTAPAAHSSAPEQSPAGRHSTAPTAPRSAALGRHVLLLGGTEPLGEMIAERLISAGHLLATANITLPAEVTPHHDRDGLPITTAEPVTLTCDRTDSDDVVHTVARAEVALGGLDALVVLPAADNSMINLDADAATWSDEWSMALTQEVLAAASACHIAARSFLARRRAGRIVLVTSRADGSGVRPSGTVHAAMTALGADLGRDLRPHGIGVSVVAAGSVADFGLGQVADVVEALLTTPVLSEVGTRIG